MDNKIIISNEAENDISNAYCDHNKEKSGLGGGFLTQLDLFYKKLKRRPTYYSFVDEEKNISALTLKVFPYKIIYEIAAEEVYAFAIHHFSRHDDHFNKRV